MKTHRGHSQNSVPTPQNTDNCTRLEKLIEKQTEQINNLLSLLTLFHTQHTSGKAHGGTGIIIKSSIKHYELPSFQKNYLQATSVAIEDCHGAMTTSAVYYPPRHSIAIENFDSLFDALGNRFIAEGDYNAKHTQ